MFLVEKICLQKMHGNIGNGNNSFTDNLTPVRFIQSPRTKFPPGDSNLQVCKERLETIVKSLQENYAKWNLAQERGLAVCQSIEAVKTRHMEEQGKTNKEICVYPQEMQKYCDKLCMIIQIFKDIVKNTHKAWEQLKALQKLNEKSQEKFYRTWTLTEFVQFVSEMLEAYENEAQIKEKIMHELPHCTTRAALIHCTSAWEYPQFADDGLSMLFIFLTLETRPAKN